MDFPSNTYARLLNGKFTDGTPLTDTPPSWIPAAWTNAVTDEMLEVIEGLGGLVRSEADNTQLRQAIEIAIGTSIATAFKGLTSLNPTGYLQIPGTSFMLQWSDIAVLLNYGPSYGWYSNASPTSFTFPLAYSAITDVHVQTLESFPGVEVGFTIASKTATGFSVYGMGAVGSGNIYGRYLALGVI